MRVYLLDGRSLVVNPYWIEIFIQGYRASLLRLVKRVLKVPCRDDPPEKRPLVITPENMVRVDPQQRELEDAAKFVLLNVSGSLLR